MMRRICLNSYSLFLVIGVFTVSAAVAQTAVDSSREFDCYLDNEFDVSEWDVSSEERVFIEGLMSEPNGQLVSSNLERAECLIKLKRFNEAIEVLDSSKEAGKSDSYYYEVLGRAKMLKGDFKGAENAYQSAIDLFPVDLWLRYALAVVLQKSGDVTNSERITNEALNMARQSFESGSIVFQRLAPNEELLFGHAASLAELKGEKERMLALLIEGLDRNSVSVSLLEKLSTELIESSELDLLTSSLSKYCEFNASSLCK